MKPMQHSESQHCIRAPQRSSIFDAGFERACDVLVVDNADETLIDGCAGAVAVVTNPADRVELGFALFRH